MTTIAFETSKVPMMQSAAEIEELLAKHGATHSAKEYDGGGRPCSLMFRMDTPAGPQSFQLPVNVEAVYQILLGMRPPRKQRDHATQAIVNAQAERTAWRNIREWVHSQMVLVQLQMVTVTQIFMPYMLVGHNETLYQRLETSGLRALGEGSDG